MIKTSKEKLPAYLHYYIKRVIGIKVELFDSPQPCLIKADKQQIGLPLSNETLEQFLGPEFVKHAPLELLFSILIGLAYHEAAHLLSGDKNVDPHILNNIICDSNDFNFVPDTWKGSIPFTISLMNTTYQQGADLNNTQLGKPEEKLQALIHMAITYLRKLRIRLKGNDLRDLPKDHILHPYFQEIKSIMRTARKAKIDERPDLVKQLYEVLKRFWNNTQSNSNPKRTLDSALKEMEPEIRIQLSGKDAQKLTKILQQLGTMKTISNELKRTASQVIRLETIEEDKRNKGALKKVKELGDLGSKITIEEPVFSAGSIEIKSEVVSKLRRALKPLLFERAIARRKPSIVGNRFAPSHFHEIKTQPNNPRIRKDIVKIGRAEVETEIVLCFDRSGSMNGEKEDICKEIAGTFYMALKTVSKAEISILGFDTDVGLIKGKKRDFTNDVLSKISTGLSARGGTDFPLALYQSLQTISESKAYKKIVIMLTDGDVHGEIDIEDLIRYAKMVNTKVITIGITGSDTDSLQDYLGKNQVIYVDEIQNLPNEMNQLILRLI